MKTARQRKAFDVLLNAFVHANRFCKALEHSQIEWPQATKWRMHNGKTKEPAVVEHSLIQTAFSIDA